MNTLRKRKEDIGCLKKNKMIKKIKMVMGMGMEKMKIIIIDIEDNSERDHY